MHNIDVHRHVHQCSFECLWEIRIVEQPYSIFLCGDYDFACALQAVVSFGDKFEVVACVVVVVVKDVDFNMCVKTLDVADKRLWIGYACNDKNSIVGCELVQPYRCAAEDRTCLLVGKARIKQTLVRNQVEVLPKVLMSIGRMLLGHLVTITMSARVMFLPTRVSARRATFCH